MFFNCKVWKERMGNQGNKVSYNQIGIGYSEYFHMSQANKLCKLRGHPHYRPLIEHRVSYEAHYSFHRSLRNYCNRKLLRTSYGHIILDSYLKRGSL